MKLAIVILNWNGIDLLKEFLPSVVKHSHGHAIYVADNASTDDSVEWLTTYYPEIKIIHNTSNLGYAGGYNAALKKIPEDLFCLLNSDVAVSAGWCDVILKEFERDVNLGAAQPKILDYSHKDTFEYAGACGGFVDQLGYPYCRGRIFNHIEMDHGQYEEPMEVDWASGASLFISKKAFEVSGGFDEHYFAHQEEIDLCWRLRRLDYKVVVFPAAQVYHLGGGTLNEIHPKKTFLNFRNSLFTILKNDLRPFVVGVIFFRMVLDGIAAITFLAQGKWKHSTAVIKAHLSFYGSLSKYRLKRKELKSAAYLPVKNKGVTSIVLMYYIIGKRRFFD